VLEPASRPSSRWPRWLGPQCLRTFPGWRRLLRCDRGTVRPPERAASRSAAGSEGKVCLGPQGPLPGLLIRFIGSILITTAMAYNLAAHRQSCTPYTSGNLTDRAGRHYPNVARGSKNRFSSDRIQTSQAVMHCKTHRDRSVRPVSSFGEIHQVSGRTDNVNSTAFSFTSDCSPKAYPTETQFGVGPGSQAAVSDSFGASPGQPCLETPPVSFDSCSL
jgi:hypothetical protein